MYGARIQDDGSMIFPCRGEAPPIIPGYESEPGNPYILRPKMPECQFRKELRIKRNCASCKDLVTYACHHSLPVSLNYCNNCIGSGKRDSLLELYNRQNFKQT